MASGVGNLMVTVGADISRFNAGMAQVQAGMASAASGIARRAGSVGTTMTKFVTLPVVAGFGLAIKAAADFESSLNDMQAVSGATGAQMAKVSKVAKQLGADTKLPGTSAKDAADAMKELAKGGMTAGQAMDAARGTLTLAAAAGIDNAEAAKIQSKALNAFELSAKDAGRVADLLAASANASTAEITDMAMSLQQSSAVAHQAGFTIEETTVALSMLANAGIAGSDAGTSLKTMLMRLQAPMGAGAKAINKLGLELRGASGELKPLPALADEFRRKTEGMSKAQKDAAMAAIFGSDAIRAGNILLGKSAADYAALTAKITEQGAAQKLAEAKMRGFNGAIEGFRSAMETAAISVGQVMLPMATKLATKITELAGKFEELTPAQQRFAVQVAGIAAAAGPVLIVLSKLGPVLSAISASSGGAGMGIAKVIGPLGLAAVAFTVLAARSESARSAFGKLGSAVAPVGEALGRLAISPVTLGMVAAAATVLALAKAFNVARTAFLAMMAAASAHPFVAFLTAAAAVTGALLGLIGSSGRAATSMRDVQDAANAAKQSLDNLKNATLGVEGANLAHKAAVLEVKAAQQGLRTVQDQVSSGAIKGKDATLALQQANLRLEQAQLGVKQSSQGVKTATAAEREEQQKANEGFVKAIQLQKERVDAAKQNVLLTHGSKEAVKALAKEEATLDQIQRQAGANADALASKVSGAGKASQAAAAKVQGLKDQMAALRSRALSVTVNTEQAILNVVGLVAEMARLASKTITVTVNKVDKRSSWNTEDTVTNLDRVKKGGGYNVPVRFTSAGTGVIEEMGRKVKLGITTAVREAIVDARANAMSLASTLSSSIGSAIDAQLNRALRSLASGPMAQALFGLSETERRVQEERRVADAAKERARLDKALAGAKTPEERMAAQEALDDFLLREQRATEDRALAAERDALQKSLEAQEQKLRDEAEARKRAADQGLRDLTDSLNRGLISQEEFNKGLIGILNASGVDYFAAGDLLGSEFARGFRDQIAALQTQIGLIVSGPGAGMPIALGTTDPFAVQYNEWKDRRDQLAKNLADARETLKKAQENAIKASSPGGKAITAAEQGTIQTLQNRVQAATSQLQNWNKLRPVRAARGGIVRGIGVRDTIPALLTPGEQVIPRNAKTGGLTININGGTFLGDSRETARELANLVTPYINRRVSIA